MSERKSTELERDALEFHSSGRPGKLEIRATKPLTTQRDLTLAYSPGVAAPCLKIHKDPDAAYELTARGNLVAIISNGTAVLGLGDLGPLGAKPVMEGKAVLFKRFADIDGINLEVDTRDVEEFVNCVRFLGKTFGGINLEDIKAPECFIIEERLQELLDIPVFHDDQHGTAIITAAGIINACHLTGRKMEDVRVVINGAGAAGLACAELVKGLGVPKNNVLLCDTRGVIYRGRSEGMNQWKSAHAVESDRRSLADALEGADIFLGLSVKGAVTKDMVDSMAEKPIVFAMANPDPEIEPAEVFEVREDAIVATGRSDYPNQVNNVLGFPYIFRGALDVRASCINMEMKVAAAKALAALARDDVPDEVNRAYSGRRLRYGPEYIIPAPFDPRLIATVPKAVAEAAIASGVARKPVADIEVYGRELAARLDPTAANLNRIFSRVRSEPKRIVFAEGEEISTIRAARAFQAAGYGTPILVGHDNVIAENLEHLGFDSEGLEIHNARISPHNESYMEFLYERLCRRGKLRRDCQRMVNQNRNVFAACMVAKGHADGMVTGLTRSFGTALSDITRALDPVKGQRLFGLSILLLNGRTLFVADTSVHELPTPEQLTNIAVQSANQARAFGHEPRVAVLSYSNFGNPMREKTRLARDTVALLDRMDVDFEYDGEMQASVALDHDLMKRQYPFCRLTGPANVLIMPGLHSANITPKVVAKAGAGTVVGPLLLGLEKPVQVVQMDSSVNDLVTAAAIAAYGARTRQGAS
jgi:malate dehydrogenase (oxaloacetate-decarboxylating)(NADP+)